MRVEPDLVNSSPTPSALSTPQWTLADLIDFELFVDEDSTASPDELAERDGEIRKKVLSLMPDSEKKQRESNDPGNRRWWLHRWVTARREAQNTEAESAGLVVEDALASIAGGLAIIGAILGFCSLLGLFAAPKVIDVPLVLLIYLGPQVVLLGFAFSAFLRQRRGLSSKRPSVILAVFVRLLTRPFNFVSARANELIQKREQLARFDAGVHLILGRGTLRREALGWPLLCLLQKTAAYFSVAVVIGMLVVCMFAHFNFGWGTTWNKINAEVVHSTVRILAAPWGWLLPEGTGYPTLDEVRLSQTFRDRPLPETFPRLSSWWAFLCLSLFTYACVPRFLLLAYSRWRSRQALNGETFKDHRSDRLFRRLAEPPFTRIVSEPIGDLQPGPISTPDQGLPTETRDTETVPSSYCEIYTELELKPQDQEDIKARIEQRLRLGVYSFNPIYSPTDQERSLKRLKALQWEDGIPRVLLLYRACDPIVANLKHLVDEFIPRIGNGGCLIFGLVGKASHISDPADSEEIQIWSEFADRLKTRHPNVEIEILTDPKP